MIEYIFIICNIFLLETMLSIDNASVLAIMVNDLPVKQRPKALKYGIFGAFLFRGLSLFIATWIVKLWLLKVIGGIYLLYLCGAHFTPQNDELEEGIDKSKNGAYLRAKTWIGAFWSTVILVEIMDMAFSVDNIFAAAAFSNNIYLILAGVFMGIIAMRFVASWFSQLIEKYPHLESSAFVVIGLLGLKLMLTGAFQGIPLNIDIYSVISGNGFNLMFSAIMILIFFTPILNPKDDPI